MMSYKVEKLDLDTLSESNREKFAFLLPSKYLCCLKGIDPYGISHAKIIAISLRYQEEPVGLILSSNYEGTGLASILLIKIEEEHQNIALANEMVQKLELENILKGANSLDFLFRDTELDSPFIEDILHENGYVEPKPYIIRYFFDSYTFNPPWYKIPPKLPDQYKIFKWENLKDTERKQLEREYAQGHFTADIYPFSNEKTIEYTNSLGLRYQGNVIGWSITHLIAPDTIRYTALFVKPEFQFTGYAARLLVESIQLQQKSPIKWSVFEILLENRNRSWLKFILKRLAPYALETDVLYKTWKMLK